VESEQQESAKILSSDAHRPDKTKRNNTINIVDTYSPSNCSSSLIFDSTSRALDDILFASFGAACIRAIVVSSVAAGLSNFFAVLVVLRFRITPPTLITESSERVTCEVVCRNRSSEIYNQGVWRWIVVNVETIAVGGVSCLLLL
jgi:hypothetical protein